MSYSSYSEYMQKIAKYSKYSTVNHRKVIRECHKPVLELHKNHLKYSVEREKNVALYKALRSTKEAEAEESCASQFCKRKQAGIMLNDMEIAYIAIGKHPEEKYHSVNTKVCCNILELLANSQGLLNMKEESNIKEVTLILH